MDMSVINAGTARTVVMARGSMLDEDDSPAECLFYTICHYPCHIEYVQYLSHGQFPHTAHVPPGQQKYVARYYRS